MRSQGFIVIPAPTIPGGAGQLAAAYDRAVFAANPSDVSIRSSTRVQDLVKSEPEFDNIYSFAPLLAACCLLIDRPFQLSTLLARTLEPGTPAHPLHVDVEWQANGWPLVGFILMVDVFTAANGATRLLPFTHLQPHRTIDPGPHENLGSVSGYENMNGIAC